MEKLNRQILGSQNWGSSVNANWGKIETGIGDLQQQLDDITDRIEVDFGVMFGGFIRFDMLTEAEKESQQIIYITQSFDDIKPNSGTPINLVPINRIYRIVGNWTPSTDVNIDRQNLYTMTWSDGNMCIRSADGYRTIFWNDYIFEPSHVNAQGQLVWAYQQAPTSTQVTTSFPANFVNAVAYKYYIEDFNSNSTYLYHVIPSRVMQVEGVAITAHIGVSFYNDINKNQPFYAWWNLDTDSDNNDILCLNKTDSFEEGDYVILTYYVKDMPAVDLLNTEV